MLPLLLSLLVVLPLELRATPPTTTTAADLCSSAYQNICDPEHILDPGESRKLDTILQRQYWVSDDASARDDVTVRVALFRNLYNAYTLSGGSNGTDPMAESARVLHRGWKPATRYSRSVLILLSLGDQRVYFARNYDEVLSDARIQRLIDRMHPFLVQKRYAEAILEAVVGIDFYTQKGRPRFGENVDDYNGALWILCGLLLLVELGKTCRSRFRDNADRDRAEKLRNQFQCDSCAICFSMFGPDSSLTLLKCGHVFDSECLKKCRFIHLRCPMCQQVSHNQYPCEAVALS